MSEQGRSERGLYFHEFVRAIREQHPEMLETHRSFLESADVPTTEDPARFQKPTEKPGCGGRAAWSLSRLAEIPGPRGEHKQFNVAASYRGLLMLKPPFDLVLYSDLIWQVQPATIIEFGAAHGGSALWLADQCQNLSPSCEVYSFDRFIDCVSPRARHPRLHFLQIDLRHLDSLDQELLQRLPHPWIVIDDAHVNVLELFGLLARFMASGDYYILEDWPITASVRELAEAASLAEQAGFMIDTRYTDAFGTNMTSAAHCWFRKS